MYQCATLNPCIVYSGAQLQKFSIHDHGEFEATLQKMHVLDTAVTRTMTIYLERLYRTKVHLYKIYRHIFTNLLYLLYES